MADLLVSARAGHLEAISTVPNPDDPASLGAPAAAIWNETADGAISVRLAGTRCKIPEPRLAWLFSEVAKAKGGWVKWDELTKRRLEFLAATKGLGEAANLDLDGDTVRRYGLLLQKRLGGLKVLWEQNGEGARWKGDRLPEP